MAGNWIDDGLQHARERADERRRALEERQHRTSAIKEKGPDLMSRLVAEVAARVEEYRRKADPEGREIEFESLPHEGFCVSKTTTPKVALECRPNYEAHVLYCNMTRTDDPASDTVELVFSLDFIVDESDHVQLRNDARVFPRVDQAVEFLLKPVLFPLIDQQL